MRGKIKSLEELKQIVKALQSQGKRVVFTNGCYDLIHVGHVRLLQDARNCGDALIVAINSDRSVRALKGAERPFVPEEERAEVLAALQSVDFVTVFDDLDPLNIITELLPDILIKGGDWTVDSIIGRGVVEKAGGTVLSLSYVEGQSTTNIIRRILKSCSFNRGNNGP